MQNGKTHASEFVDMRIMPRFPNKQSWILLYTDSCKGNDVGSVLRVVC